MTFNPNLIVRKIVFLLLIVLIIAFLGSLVFAYFLPIDIIYKIIFIAFILIISLLVLVIVIHMYKQFDKQFHELTLIHDISNSLNLTFDHDVLYQVNLFSIIEKLNFDSGMIVKITNDNKYLKITYTIGLSNKNEETFNQYNLNLDPNNNIIADAINNKDIIKPSINKDSNRYEINIEDIYELNHYIVIPLIHADTCVGGLVLNSKQSIYNYDEQLKIIITSANYLASSLYNIQLYEQLKKKLNETQKLNELARKVNSELDLDKLMETTIQSCIDLIGGERGNIFLYDKGLDALVIKASASQTLITPNIKFKPGEGIVGKVYMTGESYVVNDTSKDPNFKNRPDSPRTINSLLEVPIKTLDKTIGVLSIDNKDGGFNQNDMELLSTLSSHIGIAIENATLHKELKRYTINLERLVKRRTWQLNKANNELERQNHLLKERNHIIENDLEMARAIQQQILPTVEPEIPNFKISARYTPMDQLGGDFYDFFYLDRGKGLGFIISDVSGHGPAAAFITAMIKIACKSLSDDVFKSPKLLLNLVNQRIIGYTSSNFITAFYCYFDLEKAKLRYGCAGHNRPILIREGKVVEELYAKGRILGFMEDADFQEKEMTLAKGDRILFYTDGLSESINLQEEMYSKERIVKMIIDTYHKDVKDSLEEIYHDMLNWVKNERRIQDDIAMVMFDYTK